MELLTAWSSLNIVRNKRFVQLAREIEPLSENRINDDEGDRHEGEEQPRHARAFPHRLAGVPDGA